MKNARQDEPPLIHPQIREFSAQTRAQNIERMGKENFDLLIVGGGVNGAWTALDASLRGLRVALIEKNDYGHGPSRNNSELLHGGFRYLKEWYQNPRNWLKIKSVLHLVRDALQEREVLMKIAPHLARPMPFCMPLYAPKGLGFAKRSFYAVGFWMYDLLSHAQTIKPFRMLSRLETLQKLRHIRNENLIGSGLYYDCKMEPSRLLAEIIKGGAAFGALHANYTEAVEALWETNTRVAAGKTVVGFKCRDVLEGKTFEIRAREIVDATGPWGDVFRQRIWPELKPSLRLSKGIHIMVPQLFAEPVACAFFADDGRIVFIIPWGENYRYSLIGTTDTDYQGAPDEIAPDQKSVDYLIEKVRALFPQASLDFKGYYAGIRPLIRQESGSASSVSREHMIETHGDSHVTSVFGGKWTTARHVAAELVDHIFPQTKGKSRTQDLRLGGADVQDLVSESGPKMDASLAAQATDLQINQESIEHLIFNYGRNAGVLLQILRERPDLKAPIVPGLAFLKVEVIHAVRFEMAMRVADFLIRRSLLGRLKDRGQQAANAVAELMGDELGWNAARKKAEVDYYAFCMRLEN